MKLFFSQFLISSWICQFKGELVLNSFWAERNHGIHRLAHFKSTDSPKAEGRAAAKTGDPHLVKNGSYSIGLRHAIHLPTADPYTTGNAASPSWQRGVVPGKRRGRLIVYVPQTAQFSLSECTTDWHSQLHWLCADYSNWHNTSWPARLLGQLIYAGHSKSVETVLPQMI